MDPNVERVIDLHRKRADVGFKKYGVDTTRKDTSEIGWLVHLQEELMDAAIYAERLISDKKFGVHHATVEAFFHSHEDTEANRKVVADFLAFIKGNGQVVEESWSGDAQVKSIVVVDPARDVSLKERIRSFFKL